MKSPKVKKGQIERLSNFRSAYVSTRHIDVWLPDGYSKENRYPVLYMHDGQMLFDASLSWNKQSWLIAETMTKLISKQHIQPCIVAGVWNNNSERQADYFPQKPFDNLPQSYREFLLKKADENDPHALFAKNISSDNYLTFITKELKPYIDQNYATKPDISNTFIAGSSMGALISMYALCEYPDIFGGAACLSTHWVGSLGEATDTPIPESFLRYLEQNLPDPTKHKVYFDYGTKTLDAYYEIYQQRVDKLMHGKGFTESNWQTLKFEGHDHSELAWKKRFHHPVRFLLGV